MRRRADRFRKTRCRWLFVSLPVVLEGESGTKPGFPLHQRLFHRTRRNCPACDREQTPFSFLVISRRKPSVAQKTQPFTPHGFRALLLSRSGLSFSTEPLADSSVWIFGWDISFPLWDTRPLISLGRLTGENIYGGVPWATFSEGVLPSPLAGVHSVQRASGAFVSARR